MKIKSRKNREKEYNELYGNVSNDIYERLKNHLGNKFNSDILEKSLDRIKKTKKKIKYYMIHFTFYEKPIQTHRPRSRGGKGFYVPNSAENSKAIEKFVKNLKEDIKIISTPMKVILKAYSPMPKSANPIDIILYETEHDYAIGKPDFDNILKAYCDMIKNTIILDDDIVSSAKFSKYYSLKPRVELNIIYTNGYSSEYTYNTIKARKSFKQLSDNIEVELLCVPYKKLKKVKGLMDK